MMNQASSQTYSSTLFRNSSNIYEDHFQLTIYQYTILDFLQE
jgi:hypothetical protein